MHAETQPRSEATMEAIEIASGERMTARSVIGIGEGASVRAGEGTRDSARERRERRVRVTIYILMYESCRTPRYLRIAKDIEEDAKQTSRKQERERKKYGREGGTKANKGTGSPDSSCSCQCHEMSPSIICNIKAATRGKPMHV
jgi:hypothetical protein